MRRSFPSLFRYIALILVMTLTTSGAAMASYVCPAIATNLMRAQMMDGMPCAGMDMEKPVHCAELSADTKVSLDHHNAPPALAPLSLAVLAWMVSPRSTLILPRPYPADLPEPDTDPPYLRTLRIRI
jgi:hypothetical protein